MTGGGGGGGEREMGEVMFRGGDVKRGGLMWERGKWEVACGGTLTPFTQ